LCHVDVVFLTIFNRVQSTFLKQHLIFFSIAYLSLPTSYSPSYLDLIKEFVERTHSGCPCRAFAHCKVCAPAALRRAWLHVSEAISGLSLSRPVRIIGLLSFYLNNSLIRRSPIVKRLAALS